MTDLTVSSDQGDEVARLRAELARVQQRLQMFQTAVENASDSIIIYEGSGTIRYANPAALRIHRLDPSATLVGRSIGDLTAPEEIPRVMAEMLPMLAQGRIWSGQLTLVRPEGSRFVSHQTVVPLPPAAGDEDLVAAFGRDLTEQIAREEQLSAIVSSAPLVLFAVNRDGIFTLSDGSGLAVLGLKPGQVVGMSIFDLYRDYPEFIAALRRGLAGERVQLTTTSPELSFEHNLVPLRDRLGEVVGLTGVSIDITERTRAEAERVAMQKQVIEAQEAVLRELSTPLIPIADRVIAMPLIGSIDSARAQQLTEALLESISTQKATVAIIDITGVRVVDTQVAGALLRSAQAAQLLGAEVVLTGIGPEVAQTLVTIGADMSRIVTRGSFQAGIAYAMGRR